MKKIFTALVVFCAVFSVLPVCGCSQENAGNITGGACSIKELNNLEKQRSEQGKIGSLSKMKVDLRPVRQNQEIRKNENPNCILGTCLYQTILDK